MSKRIFLTGALGFLGSHLYPKLIEQGYEVETDMRYLFTKKYDCVIHLAAKNNIKNEFDADLIESNIILTREIFKVNCRVLYASSCVAKYDTTPYARSKMYAEHLGAIHGNALGLRFHNIYGKNNSKGIVWFLMNQKDGAKITIRGPELIRDYIYVDDVVNAIIANINPPQGLINMNALANEMVDKKQLEKQLINFSMETGIRLVDSNPPQEEYNKKSQVIDIGTGIGTKTIDLVSLYSKLSGKRFGVEVIPPDASEPISMISNNVVPHISLEEGLKGILKGYLSQPVLSDIYNHIKNNK